MKREELSDVIGGIDETLILEASRYDSTLSDGSSERIVHMKKKRIIVFALAAALIVAFGIGAYATGLFGSKPETSVEPIDRDDLGWWELYSEDLPNANEFSFTKYAPHDNPITAEVEAMLPELEEREDPLDLLERKYKSVREMGEAYGIELLHSGSGEDNVYGYLSDEKDPVVSEFSDGKYETEIKIESGPTNLSPDFYRDYEVQFNSLYIQSVSGSYVE